MASLVLGPLLRYVGRTDATVWVEVDSPCDVDVLGHQARTFEVRGHHYALVEMTDLGEGSTIPYEVRLDGEVVWPADGAHPPSAIHTRAGEDHARLVFGSCRVGAPQREPYTLAPSEHGEGHGIDALWAYARRLMAGIEPWPDALLFCGDQVYADEVSPETARFIRSRRDTSKPPGEEVADFEEYTRLYRETWSDPEIRWLLSTVPSLMIFDDHDVIDDWNISWQWLKDARKSDWWHDRITGAFMSYWIYQHLGNLSPSALAEEEMYRRAVASDGDVGPELEAFARQADLESAAARWAFCRDFGHSRVLGVDSRAARALGDDRRDLVDTGEWAWIVDRSHEAVDHLVIVSTLPVFMSSGVHYLEAWNEAVCAGAWGRPAAWAAERIRRALDLEHWPAFQTSFAEMVSLLRDVATGVRGGRPPASVTLVGGDIHNSYVAEVSLGRWDASRGRVYQLVCSPFRNPLPPLRRRLVRLAGTRLLASALGELARLAGVRQPTVRWRYVAGPTFENSIGIMELSGRRAEVTIFGSGSDHERDGLEPLHTRVLAKESPSGVYERIT